MSWFECQFFLSFDTEEFIEKHQVLHCTARYDK